jgi:hypothetical protein
MLIPHKPSAALHRSGTPTAKAEDLEDVHILVVESAEPEAGLNPSEAGMAVVSGRTKIWSPFAPPPR